MALRSAPAFWRPSLPAEGTDAAARPVPRVGRARAQRLEDLALFLVVGLPGLALAYLLSFVLRTYEGDALSRTFQAVSVLYSEPARLANIGFIWTPLPTIVQIPIVAVRALAVNGFAGQIASVGFAAASLVVLNRLLQALSVGRAWRYVLLAVYQLHPLILIYAVNGMTESMLIFWILVAVYGLVGVWRRRRERIETTIVQLALMGAAAACAFLTRYEGAVFGLALGAALVVLIVSWEGGSGTRAEGMLLAYAAPWAYAIVLWFLANWLIMRDPFHFATGRGSNREQAAAWVPQHPHIQALQDNLPQAAAYVAHLLTYVYPAVFVVLALLLLRAWLARDRFALALAMVTAALPAFQVAMHYAGQSFGYVRFHIYVIPLTVVGAGYLVSHVGQARALWYGVTAVGLVAASAGTALDLDRPVLGTVKEGVFRRALLHQEAIGHYAAEREMAAYLRELLQREPGSRILVDELGADGLIVFTGYFERFVTTRHPRFRQLVVDPIGQVDYLLASDLGGGNDQVADVLATDGGHSYYLELVHQAGEGDRKPAEGASVWSLYRVLNAPVSPDLNAVPADPGPLRTLLAEDFTTGGSTVGPASRRAWPHDPQGGAWLGEGGYRLAQRQKGQLVAVGAPVEAPLRDVVVSATFRRLAGGPDGSYGLIVRGSGPGPLDGVRQNGQYYLLQVNDLGGVSIWRRDHDHWVERLPWSPAAAVQLQAPNELQVQAIGAGLTFVVNGVQVARLTDTFLRQGAVGMFVGGDGTEVAVERFTVQVPGSTAEGAVAGVGRGETPVPADRSSSVGNGASQGVSEPAFPIPDTQEAPDEGLEG